MTEIAKQLEVFHVFLSSPSDMEVEREAVREFFKALNQGFAKAFGLQFDVLDWENSVDIGYEDPQELLIQRVLERYRGSLALVIGLMGQRFGTPAGQFESGTQQEFEWAARHREQHGHPEIKWFFRRIDNLVLPTSARPLREAVEQWKKVQRFRKNFKGLYREFETARFSDVLREDLYRWLAGWAQNRSLPGASRDATPTQSVLPAFLDNRLSRTMRIVSALEDMIRDSGPYVEPTVRICAVMSSLAITDDGMATLAGDKEYSELILKERNLIEHLAEQEVSLMVLLTWNVWEIAEWQERSKEDVIARLRQLKSFCLKTLENEERVSRVRMLHIGVRERNLMILGRKFVFEGRKLDARAGFEATEVIVDATRVAQEIQMFDLLFRNSVRKSAGDVPPADRNRHLLRILVQRIDRDVESLSATSGEGR